MASNNYRTVSCAVLFILPWQWQTAGPTSVLCQLLDKIQACKFKSYWRPLKIKIHPSKHELLNNSAVIPQTEHARAKKKTLLSYCQKMCIKGTRSFEKHGKNWLGYIFRRAFGFTFYTFRVLSHIEQRCVWQSDSPFSYIWINIWGFFVLQ